MRVGPISMSDRRVYSVLPQRNLSVGQMEAVMRKGEPIEEVFISPAISVQVCIDEDDVGMWRMRKIEDGAQFYSDFQVASMGPVNEIVCERIPGSNRFVVAYIKADGIAYAKQGKFAGDVVYWSAEVTGEPCFEHDAWLLGN